MAIRSNGLDTTDRKMKAANDIGEDYGLEAWASGKRSFETDPGGTEFVKGVGSDFGSGPREIASCGPTLNDEDKAALESGAAILTYKHDEVLTDRDRELIQSGKAKVLPKPIPQDRAGSLTADELSQLARGEAVLVASSAPAPTEFRKGADGRLQIPQDRLHEALDRGACSIADIAAGRAVVVG